METHKRRYNNEMYVIWMFEVVKTLPNIKENFNTNLHVVVHS
jgi:hypothetical protein